MDCGVSFFLKINKEYAETGERNANLPRLAPDGYIELVFVFSVVWHQPGTTALKRLIAALVRYEGRERAQKFGGLLKLQENTLHIQNRRWFGGSSNITQIRV